MTEQVINDKLMSNSRNILARVRKLEGLDLQLDIIRNDDHVLARTRHGCIVIGPARTTSLYQIERWLYGFEAAFSIGIPTHCTVGL